MQGLPLQLPREVGVGDLYSGKSCQALYSSSEIGTIISRLVVFKAYEPEFNQ